MSIRSPHRAFAGVHCRIAAEVAAAHVAAQSIAGVPARRVVEAGADARVAGPHAVKAFLVKYRGGQARMNAQRLHGVLREVEAGFSRPAGLRRVRRDAKGADMIQAVRALERVEAGVLIERMLRDPSVEYVVSDGDTRRIDERIDTALELF